MFSKRYIMLILTLVALFMTMCMVSETYAKYVTSATSTSSTSIARWRILVNNDDITLGSASTNLITPVFPGSTDISSGVLAPNAEGYFDLVLDYSNVDVSFNYTITVAVNEDSPVTELVATKYIIDGGQEVNFGANQAINGTVRLNEVTRTKNIRVYVKWDDTLDLMDNEDDTDTTVGNQSGMIDVTVTAIQI